MVWRLYEEVMMESDEHIVLRIRPHALKPLQAIVWLALALVLPLWWIGAVYSTSFYQSLNPLLVGMVLGLYAIVVIGMFAGAAANWFGSQAYVTNRRIVLTRQHMRRQTMWSLNLASIDKAKVTYTSRMARLFHIGNVQFTFADQAISLQAINHPEQLVSDIVALHEGLQGTVPIATLEQIVKATPVPAVQTEAVTHITEPEPGLITVAEIPVAEVPADAWRVPAIIDQPPVFSTSMPIELHEGEAVYF